MQTIKVLFMSDWGDTGFGTVIKELCARLAEMEIFEIHCLGWHSTPNDIPLAQKNKIHLHTTQFWNLADQFGAQSFNSYIENIQPTVVISLGDPWMVEHVQNCPKRKAFIWIAYMPIDRDIISKVWQSILKGPDLLLTYSKFGEDTVKRYMPFRSVETILHGVDRMIFKPWYPAGTGPDTPHADLMRERKRITLGPQFADKFIVGFVGRNQVRKNIPRTIRAFKAFNCKTWINKEDITVKDPVTGGIQQRYNAEEFCRNKQLFRCDVCPAFQQREETENSIIYLHTTRGTGDSPHDRPGIGWYIDEIAERHELRGRVGMTPGVDALRGIPRNALAQIMNCFDVHVFLTYSEGFGLPCAETLSCGVPTLVTDYSSMPEIVAGGGGYAIRPRDFITFVTWENEMASADIGDAADRINDVFKDEELAKRLRQEAADNDYVPDWNDVTLQFRRLILRAVGQPES